jgi:hypothetical protein
MSERKNIAAPISVAAKKRIASQIIRNHYICGLLQVFLVMHLLSLREETD